MKNLAVSENASNDEVKFTPKRGRPSSTQLAAIESSILSTARAMFLARGYADTSMDAIAATAGVSKGTLYARHSDKSDLFDAVARNQLDEWSNVLPHHRFMADVGLPERLFQRGLGLLRAFEDSKVVGFSRLLAAEADRFPELTKAFREQGFRWLIEQMREDITVCAKKTGHHVVDADSVALAFVNALYGFTAMRLTGGHTHVDSAVFVSRLVALLIGGKSAW